ncbi:hypothetical protein HMPREF3232_00657 [Fannyhessea vaginae]|nr:hypothetical protein HMPREF3232_00657 [Fannyhessea vaginae]
MRHNRALLHWSIVSYCACTVVYMRFFVAVFFSLCTFIEHVRELSTTAKACVY